MKYIYPQPRFISTNDYSYFRNSRTFLAHLSHVRPDFPHIFILSNFLKICRHPFLATDILGHCNDRKF